MQTKLIDVILDLKNLERTVNSILSEILWYPIDFRILSKQKREYKEVWDDEDEWGRTVTITKGKIFIEAVISDITVKSEEIITYEAEDSDVVDVSVSNDIHKIAIDLIKELLQEIRYGAREVVEILYKLGIVDVNDIVWIRDVSKINIDDDKAKVVIEFIDELSKLDVSKIADLETLETFVGSVRSLIIQYARKYKDMSNNVYTIIDVKYLWNIINKTEMEIKHLIIRFGKALEKIETLKLSGDHDA